MTLDATWAEVVNWMESLPDHRTPAISLDFARIDDFRRAAMNKHGSPLISFSATITLKKTDSELAREIIARPYTGGGNHWRMFRARHTDPDLAITAAWHEAIRWHADPTFD